MQYIYILVGIYIIYKIPAMIRWFIKLIHCLWLCIGDLRKIHAEHRKGIYKFNKFGLIMFVGRQGQGKTLSLVYYARQLKQQYPKLKIYANFTCNFADGIINNLNDLLNIRNGEDGVLFLIDEIQNEFSSAASKDFPESLLSTITMQRKQRIHIATTSQVFMRVAKPVREQCFRVVECRTYLNRWTTNRCYDAIDYNSVCESTSLDAKRKLIKLWKLSFIQTDELRNCYDTYEVVQRISRQGFAAKLNIPADCLR